MTTMATAGALGRHLRLRAAQGFNALLVKATRWRSRVLDGPRHEPPERGSLGWAVIRARQATRHASAAEKEQNLRFSSESRWWGIGAK